MAYNDQSRVPLGDEELDDILVLVLKRLPFLISHSSVISGMVIAQQPRPHSPTGDLDEIAGVNGQHSEGMCQGGKPGTGKLYTDVCLCSSAHTSGCVVDGLGATAAF